MIAMNINSPLWFKERFFPRTIPDLTIAPERQDEKWHAVFYKPGNGD